MSNKVLAVGADHGGFEDKKKIVAAAKAAGWRVIDTGTFSAEAADYPVFAFRVAETVGRGWASLGVLLCRSGNGMAMAANKVPGVRAAIATTAELARLAREHNNANILVLGSDHTVESIQGIFEEFLKAAPEPGRHARRCTMIDAYGALTDSTLPTDQLASFGQSVWLDDISDMIIASGELRELVEKKGVRGLTSNPSIFEKAIGSGQGRYKAELGALGKAGVDAEAAYEKLTTADIAAAADILRPLHDATGGDDGFVSLEVLPSLAHDEEVTVKEAIRLFHLLNRPNVMIKVPGTAEGIRAFRRLTAEGINVNVTLLFSRSNYNAIARAYIAGLKDRLAAGGDITRVRSVASVFVSRIDTAVDKTLAEKRKGAAPAEAALIDAALHNVAIANTKMIYQDFKQIFQGAEFAELAEKGATAQRPLWGSTGMKDPGQRDTRYVEELAGAWTVNTIPAATLAALYDHGKVRRDAIEEDLAGAQVALDAAAKSGIDLEAVCADLQTAGVKSFSEAFDKLFETVKTGLKG